jgi:hypothetical protein
MATISNHKTGILFLGLLMLFFMPSMAKNISIDSYAFDSEPIIDGIIDEGWNRNKPMDISHFITTEKVSENNFSGRFRISWFNNNLYFLFEVTDDILVLHKGQPIWEGDNINLYLDLGNEKTTSYDNNDYLFHFKWGNSDYYERFNGQELVKINNLKTDVEFAQTCDTINHKYIMEIAFRNIVALNGPKSLTDSTYFGLDAGIYDCDDTSVFSNMYTNHLSWVDTTGYAWSDPSKLGTAGFASIRLKSAKIIDTIEKQCLKNLVNIYPTVVSECLNISLDNNEDMKVEINNLVGEKVKSVILRPGNNSIDVASFKNGVYFINVVNKKSNLIFSQKIVKQ